ncbi:YfgM family protein [Marinobacterium sediminicola]|uniref:Ancillary SecYEG translocon subunit n=1 Tax=Marinobacterium sediminicola TaxID=518898 RepID=A0ABY1S3N1_9GAMM|nr:tetratricopeptide repeat protein [Marinobacterium sediminicola]ULG69904.1 tetratricopeptide repeat protein [Marinobacterium sediminicola]SMR77815.1 Putative negative regulator of RcsB-dependent stress response [Marinobacterium sediminicola]
MAELRTEEEQLQALKAWWQENGKSLVLGVGLAIALVLGWQGWQSHQQQKAASASALYQNLTEAAQLQAMNTADNAQYATAKHLTEQLKADFADTTYARYAGLVLAAMHVQQEEYAAAITELDWVLSASGEVDSIKRVATLRKALVMQQQGAVEAAVELVKGLDAGTFEAEKQELLGDLYLSIGNVEQARTAYDAALLAAGGEARKPLLKIKRDDLAEVKS